MPITNIRHERILIYFQTKTRIDTLFPIKESGNREKMWDFLGPACWTTH
jgi:hypothetical protein